MQRVIKFRFWSKLLGRFVIPQDDIFVGALKDPDMAVMQFTGLHDKNGTPIFEGDIVQSNGGFLNRVEFIDGCFGHKERLGMNHNKLFLQKDMRDPIVIGNIWENPELFRQNILKRDDGGSV